MRVKIEKGRTYGSVTAPPSKSMAHRLLICAAMCRGTSKISGISSCEDVLATIDCLKALGAKIEFDGDSVTVTGTDMTSSHALGTLNARESGSTLRFLIPIAILSSAPATFIGKGRLMERPMEVYEKLFADKGLKFTRHSGEITVSGPLSGGDFYLAGDVSSQFISGLLFALPMCESDSKIIITTAVESRSYINLTMSAMNHFGVRAVWQNDNTIFISGNQTYLACDMTVEGDYSGAAFIDALGALHGNTYATGLASDSMQGDRVYMAHFKALRNGTPTISIEDCPDLGPILFTLAAALNGGCFTGTRRLEIKESNRAIAMAEELGRLGADITVEENRVTVRKTPLHSPTGVLLGHNDHRIVMSLAVLLTLLGGEIDGAEAVNKSYPSFFDDIKRLGIKADFYET